MPLSSLCHLSFSFVLATFLVAVENNWKGALKQGRVYYGSQFKGTVYHDEEVMVARALSPSRTESGSSEQQMLVPSRLSLFCSV